jgi:phosphatidate cytidylyltransferase
MSGPATPDTTPPHATPPHATSGRHSNLLMRVLAAVVLVPVAVGAAYGGGPFWMALATLGAAGLFIEWQMLVKGAQTAVLAAGVFALVLISAALNLHDIGMAIICVGAGALATGAFTTREARLWAPAGMVYAGSALLAAVLIRQDGKHGFAALLFVLLIVWLTDILGYFAGRGVGGPKLWVRVSPNKTWAGAIGSTVGSLVFAIVYAWLGFGEMVPLAILGVALSVVAQLGDLLESAVKRHFGVKDSSHLIPGHGGLLDRLDGLVAALAAAALLGVLRSGTDAVGQGLLIW